VVTLALVVTLGKTWKESRVIPFGGSILLILLLGFQVLRVAPQISQGTWQETRRGRVLVDKPDEALKFLCEKIPPRTKVLVYPYYSTYYFLADLENPSRFSLLLYRYNSDSHFRETIEAIERSKVEWVLLDTLINPESYERWFPGFPSPKTTELVLESYVHSRYNQVASLGDYQFWHRQGLEIATNGTGLLPVKSP
jgi:hypothetical protein